MGADSCRLWRLRECWRVLDLGELGAQEEQISLNVNFA